jgi:hypothetical protein
MHCMLRKMGIFRGASMYVCIEKLFSLENPRKNLVKILFRGIQCTKTETDVYDFFKKIGVF